MLGWNTHCGHGWGMRRGCSRTSPGHCKGYTAGGLSLIHLPHLGGTPSSAPPTTGCQLPPTVPSQTCCTCVVSRKVVIEQQSAQQPWGQGCLQGEQHVGKGGGTDQCVMLRGQSTHVLDPKLCPEKLCHWTGQAQTSLSRERAQHIAQLITTYMTGCGHKGYAAHQ